LPDRGSGCIKRSSDPTHDREKICRTGQKKSRRSGPQRIAPPPRAPKKHAWSNDATAGKGFPKGGRPGGLRIKMSESAQSDWLVADLGKTMAKQLFRA
jgi:hypothetical protein